MSRAQPPQRRRPLRLGEPVGRARRRGRDVALLHIALHGGAVAFARIAVASAARRGQAETVARLRPAVGELGWQLLLALGAEVEPHGAGRARLAAEQSRRGPDRALAFERVSGRVEELDLSHAPEPAAPPAGSSTVLDQLVARDP